MTSYHLEATEDFFKSLDSVDTLIEFARCEENEGRQQNRDLFLNLGVVNLVTKFQVVVESSLQELLEKIQQSMKTYQELPVELRLNALKYRFESSKILPNKLAHPQKYNQQVLQQVAKEFELFHRLCLDSAKIDREFQFDTQFPMGKQGFNELKKLYQQFQGKDNIFATSSLDMNKLNEILNRRHLIVHEDRIQPLTILQMKEYKVFLEELIRYLDKYLGEFFLAL
jgi:hypothetical protein